MLAKLAAISPRTNAFMSAGTPESPEQSVFEDMFSKLAYSILESKMPRLMDSVVTFKVLDSDLERSTALGVFIVSVGPSFVYVPAVLAGDKVEPPEVMYHKDSDSFLPLDKAWIEEIQKDTTTPLGGPGAVPDGAANGQALDGITTPPNSGRFSYASARLNLPEFLEAAPNSVKTAFADFLKENHHVLKAAVAMHGDDKLVGALSLREEKVAAAPADEYWVLSTSDPAASFDAAFGSAGRVAFQKAARDGVIARDRRKTASVPVDHESPMSYTEVTTGGTYKVLDSEGKVHTVAVFCDPANINQMCESHDHGIPHFGSYARRSRHRGDRYLVLFPNGDYSLVGNLVALATTDKMPGGVVKKALGESSVASLRNGKQALVSTEGGFFRATKPFRARGVSRAQDGNARAEVVDWWDSSYSSGGGNKKRPPLGAIVVAPKLLSQNIHAPPSGNTVFVPKHFTSVALKKRIDGATLVQDMTTLMDLINAGLVKHSSHQVRVKNSGQGDWAVDGRYVGDLAGCVSKLAADGMHAEAALQFCKGIHQGTTKSAHVVPAAALGELGELFKQANPMMGGGGGMPPGMDPSMMGGGGGGMPPGMDPSMMGGAPPGMGGAPPGMGGAPPINPQFMEAAADLRDAGVFDTAAVASLVQSPELTELAAQYLPDLEKSLDGMGRIYLSLIMKQEELRAEIGEDDFSTLLSKMKQVFRGLGDLIIRLDRHTLAAAAPSVEGLGSSTWMSSGP